MLSALKNFAVTFLVSLLVFGVIAYFATSFVAGTVESILKSEKEELDSIINDPGSTSEWTGDETQPIIPGEVSIDGDSFTMLFATTDYLPGTYDDYVLSADDMDWYEDVHPAKTVGVLKDGYREAHISSLVLLRADKHTQSFVYIYISPYISVSTTSGERTLSDVYYRFGMDRLEDHITALTGFEIDYSFLLSGQNMEAFTGVAGTVLVNCPKDVYYDGMNNTYASNKLKVEYDEDGAKTTVSVPNDLVLYSGELEMTSRRIYSSLSVIEHSKADVGTKQAVATSIAEEYVKGFASLSKARLGETLTNLILTRNVFSTSFNVNDLDSVYELLSYAGEFTSVKLLYPCSYVAATDNTGEFFRPAVDEAVKSFEVYRK